MADGRSRVVGLAGGDDVFRTRRALAQLGVQSTIAGSAVSIDGHGVDAFTEPGGIVDCGNSGTTIRLLSGLLAGRRFLSVLTGDDSLVQRPMGRVVAAAARHGRAPRRPRRRLAPAARRPRR